MHSNTAASPTSNRKTSTSNHTVLLVISEPILRDHTVLLVISEAILRDHTLLLVISEAILRDHLGLVFPDRTMSVDGWASLKNGSGINLLRKIDGNYFVIHKMIILCVFCVY